MKKEDDNQFRVRPAHEIGVDRRDVIGDEYQDILKQVAKVFRHQKEIDLPSGVGVKGFLFYGDVGIGKTTVAKALASSIADRLIFVDGVDIARPRYGEAEAQIGKVFEKAQANDSGYTIILIDDCESVFPSRDWMKGESWHVAQNNVFFHELDNIDTSKAGIILTTNRFDLIDKAVKDRLQTIEFPHPSEETLLRIAEMQTKKLGMDSITDVKASIEDGDIKTMRDLENKITEEYIDGL